MLILLLGMDQGPAVFLIPTMMVFIDPPLHRDPETSLLLPVLNNLNLEPEPFLILRANLFLLILVILLLLILLLIPDADPNPALN